jgi:hypothetical protein
VSQTRIYLPLDPAGVRRLAADREAGPAPLRAFAVTDRIERALPDGDEELWEYAALAEAADAASLAAGPGDRRVVAAADVEPGWVNVEGDSGATVVVREPVPLARFVAFHVDENAGDEGTRDLLWYDATELEEVLRLLSS